MSFSLYFTEEAAHVLKKLEKTSSQAGLLKQVRKSLGYLETNPRHPSLKTHPYSSIDHPFDPSQKVFEAYAQNNTSGAYRIFWCYGPLKNEITIITMCSSPLKHLL